MSNTYNRQFVPGAEDIDLNGHVNNAVWVHWMEDLAVEHWYRHAPAPHLEAYAWVVTRHEIDYRANVGEGAVVTGLTEIREGPRGARFNRYFTFTDEPGRVLVRAKTSWAMIDRNTRRVMRVPPEVAQPFAPQGGWADQASASSSASKS